MKMGMKLCQRAWTCEVLCQEMHPCGLALLHHQGLTLCFDNMPMVVMPEVCLSVGAWLPVTSQGAAGDQCTSSRFRLPAELYPSGLAIKHTLDAAVSPMRANSQ